MPERKCRVVETRSDLVRETILAIVDELGALETAETWLWENRNRLAYVSQQAGCGCCVVDWNTEGPREVLETVDTVQNLGGGQAAPRQRPAGPALGIGHHRRAAYDLVDAGGSICSNKFQHYLARHPALPVATAELANSTPRFWTVSTRNLWMRTPHSRKKLQ
jgi:hypothetical protein